ncbi:hypothetical protein QTP86_004753 [Hemibagrus guttatus]|nr:hypothetical protein QTP86_004753 [Hemibagrus guttatus]
MKLLTMHGMLTTTRSSVSVVALLDSGSAGNFISGTLCRQLGLRTKATPTSYQIQSIIGKPISRRQVSRSTGPVLLQVGVLHVEEITLLVLEESMADVILGRPWLEQHNPILSWHTGEARWALFFTRFNFTISYRPGSKNTKADALSRMFTPEESPETPKPILPENIIVSPITWSEETLPPANASTNTPPGCPPGSQYIPRARRTALIHSAHTSLGTGHHGIHETLSLLKDRFWWPNMTADVRRYVQGCEECALSKDPCHLPSGKLLPLPVPSCPWSHLVVDFVTDLPTSRNHTCVFVVVDRFSKSCRLLPLKGPPHGSGDSGTNI